MRHRLEAARARSDTREWVVKRRERTRHLIELGGLVAKAGLVELTGDDRAAIYGALLTAADRLRDEDARADARPLGPPRASRLRGGNGREGRKGRRGLKRCLAAMTDCFLRPYKPLSLRDDTMPWMCFAGSGCHKIGPPADLPNVEPGRHACGRPDRPNRIYLSPTLRSMHDRSCRDRKAGPCIRQKVPSERPPCPNPIVFCASAPFSTARG